MKPAGRSNTVSFAATLGKEETRLDSIGYQLLPLSVSGSGLYRYRGEGALELQLKSNSFAVQEIAHHFPKLKKYAPSGTVQGVVRGTGTGLGRLSPSGEVTFAGCTVHPGGKIKPVSHLQGTVRFTADSLETPRLTGRLGSSQIAARGSLSGFKKPNLELSFSSPALYFADLGFSSGASLVKAEKVSGALSYREGTVQIDSLSAQLGSSMLQANGRASQLKEPQVEVAVTSPYLELEDLVALSQLSAPPGGAGGARRPVRANATVHAAEGRLRDVPFKDLEAHVHLEDRILYLQPVEFSGFDGEVSARVRLDLGAVPSRYQVNFTGHNLSAEKIMKAIGVERQELTGKASLQGELSARGSSAAEIKRSALGALKLKVEDGSIRKFATLSKIFSILNVSQLLKFRLPDMVSGGMPFNRITGDIAVRDGFASTSNLYLDSHAINMTTVGRYDLVRNELDLTVGVQPLQTVDKIVSRIPVVGYVLTGKDRTLVTTYFEAKGKAEDPQVRAIPMKSLAKGVLNVFKRMFELPGRLITDMGQVITTR